MLVQATLLFREDTWEMSPRIGDNSDGFHHRLACWLEVMRLRWYTMGRYVYPPLDAAMTEVGLDKVKVYILHRQNTIAQ